MPGNRRGMLRRHSQSKLMAMLEHLLAMLWGIGVFIAVLGSVWAALPVVLAVLVLAFFRPARAPIYPSSRTRCLHREPGSPATLAARGPG
jgi:hypothetical protein